MSRSNSWSNLARPASRFLARPGLQRGGLWLAIGFALLVTLNFLWEILDHTPPAWDMAGHQLMGFRYLEAWQQGHLLRELPRLSTYYPPLYYLLEAVVLGLNAESQFLALWCNLPGLAMLSYGTYRLAGLNLPPLTAAAAGLLAPLFPLVAWVSRESLLDLSLAGGYATALWIVVKSDWLRHRYWSWLFGLLAAILLLIKWTFAVFAIAPVLFALYCSRDRKSSFCNLLESMLLAIPAVFWWYLPNLKALYGRFFQTAAAALLEQDPGLDQLGGWLYYPRSLSSYYLFLPLTLVMLLALWKSRGGWNRPLEQRFIWVSLWSGILLMSLLQAKDPRYIMPLAGPLAVLLLTPWATRPRRVALVLGTALLQFLLVSFPFPGIPQRIGFFEVEGDTDYLSMGREWVWFETNYFGVLGPARYEDWGYRDMLDLFGDQDQVCFLPESARLHPAALQLAARKLDRSLTVTRIGDRMLSDKQLLACNGIVGKTGSQGLSYFTRYNSEIHQRLAALGWNPQRQKPLPDGSHLLLWTDFPGIEPGSQLDQKEP